ncbi:hypothetical protein D3C72_1853030 [compost metagenome]
MPVDLGQVALAEHQQMPPRVVGLVGQRLPELVDEILPVGQAGDGIPIDLALQGFDPGVLFLYRGRHSALRVHQCLIHPDEFARSRQWCFVARGKGAYALADVARGSRFYPADEVDGEERPEDASGQHQAKHSHAALP